MANSVPHLGQINDLITHLDDDDDSTPHQSAFGKFFANFTTGGFSDIEKKISSNLTDLMPEVKTKVSIPQEQFIPIILVLFLLVLAIFTTPKRK